MPTFEISLIAPCLNEQDNIPSLTARFLEESRRRNVHSQLVIVDDGSTDLTWSVANKQAQQWPNQVVCCRHKRNLGIPAAWKTGVGLASGRFVGLIDSDLQNPPESVLDMYRVISGSDIDLVRGIRRPVKDLQVSRILMSKILNSLLNQLFKMDSQDNKSGFLLGTKSAMELLVNPKLEYSQYQTFIGVAANSLRLRTVELETPFEERRHGASFLDGRTLTTIREVLEDLTNARIEFLRHASARGEL